MKLGIRLWKTVIQNWGALKNPFKVTFLNLKIVKSLGAQRLPGILEPSLVGAPIIPEKKKNSPLFKTFLSNRDLFLRCKRSPRPEVIRMGTDWLIKVSCSKAGEIGKSREEHIKDCIKCPYVIWGEPKTVAGIFQTMCGIRVGNVYRAAALDAIEEKLSGIERFTKKDGSPTFKRNILGQIKEYTERNGWVLNGLSKVETIGHLDTLIKFCKRAEDKGLDIWA